MGSKKQNKAHEEVNTVHTAVDVSTPKMKSGKRKRDSGMDSSLDASETYKENVETGSKKRKKESNSNLPENETTDFTSETIHSQTAKKSKKDKKKKGSTLGVVDVDILQQAEVNFQAKIADYNANCNDEEPVKKKKHSKKTKRVSFIEPVETTELPSKKKKHKKSKSQDLISEDISDKNESEQSTKKRKHTEIEAQIAPSEELIEDNGREQSSKKQKHKEKKSQTVSPEKITETNGDGSEQPKNRKRKHKEKKAEEISPEDLKKDNESEQPAKKKKKKEKMPTVTPSKDGDDMNRHERALQYLRLWQSSRNSWKFNKMMQVHLLHVMYDTSMMVDADFQILLLYLDGLKGKGRKKTMEDARKILDSLDTEVDAGKEDRARQLYQMLA